MYSNFAETIIKYFDTNQKISKFAMGNIKLSKEEKELIEAIRLYKKLEGENRLFTDYILYLRGYIEQVLESNNE